MKALTISVALLLSSTTIQAQEWPEWQKQTLTKAQEYNAKAKEISSKREVTCSKVNNEMRQFCNNAYNSTMQRYLAISAQLLFRLAAGRLPKADAAATHLTLTVLASPEDLNKEQKSVFDAWQIIYSMFPYEDGGTSTIPKKSCLAGVNCE